MQDTGYREHDIGYRIQDAGYRIQDTGYRIRDRHSFLERKNERTMDERNGSFREMNK